jgi:hypothetical protein
MKEDLLGVGEGGCLLALTEAGGAALAVEAGKSIMPMSGNRNLHSIPSCQVLILFLPFLCGLPVLKNCVFIANGTLFSVMFLSMEKLYVDTHAQQFLETVQGC